MRYKDELPAKQMVEKLKTTVEYKEAPAVEKGELKVDIKPGTVDYPK